MECDTKNSEVLCEPVLQPKWWYSHCRHSCNDRSSIDTAAAVGVSSHGLLRNGTTCLWFFGSALHIKKDSTHFQGPKCCNRFFWVLKHKSSPFSVPKLISDCVQSHGESIGTPLDPPVFWLDNRFTWLEPKKFCWQGIENYLQILADTLCIIALQQYNGACLHIAKTKLKTIHSYYPCTY